ncbi:MAG TPA: thioesterase domain-containing protein [Methylomirabilota bacterium]|nr:thioesterase domain-containing protein [Methylomirabilota bacterium]
MAPAEIHEEPSLAIHFQLISIWERLLHKSVHGIEENFFELGGAALLPQMLHEIERLTGKKVALSEVLKEPTIGHLAQCLLADTRSDGLFVCVQRGTGEIPFYYFHGDILGGGFYSRRLTKLLGPERPFYVSAPLELGEDELPSVEELAARKREALQQRQPHGPYLLGGFCVGAVVAYEVARQLAAQGEEVCDVLLIEPEIGNVVTRSHQRVVNRLAARRAGMREKVANFIRGLEKIERLRNVWRAPLREKKEFVLRNGRKILALASVAPTKSAGEGEDHARNEMTDRDWQVLAYQWVLNSYIPRRHRGRLTLFLTAQHLEETPFVLRQWKRAAPQTRVVPIPGQHLSCITTHLDVIAAQMRAEIEALKLALVRRRGP